MTKMYTSLNRLSALTTRTGQKYNYKRIKVPKYKKKRYKKMNTSLSRLSVLATRTGQKYQRTKVPKYKKNRRKVQKDDKDDLLFEQMAGFYKQSFKSFWNQATFY